MLTAVNTPGCLESLLFLSGDGLSLPYLAEKFKVTEAEMLKTLETLGQKYSGDCGIHLIRYRKNYQLTTNPQYAEAIAEVLNPIREKSLTRAALETLAIIAYKQPITKAEIEDIRGTDATYALQILAQNNVIEVTGKKDAVGSPFLYATTDTFLKRFELESIENLPSYEELLDKLRTIHTGPGLYDRGE